MAKITDIERQFSKIKVDSLMAIKLILINPVRELTPFRDLSLTGLTRGIRLRVRRIWHNPAASRGVFSNGIN